ncbi:MAG: DUF1800 domain-containing protein [Sphingomonadales bacterium]|nr:DUF1800 domain-containing protein [Sphingomonadales bacterium]
MSIAAAIAHNRFGYGLRPDEKPTGSPKRFLLEQLERFDPSPPAISAQPKTYQLAQSYDEFLRQGKKEKEARKPLGQQANIKQAGQSEIMDGRKMARRTLRDHYTEAGNARLLTAVRSDTDFPERLVHFWSNHFAVSAEKPVVNTFAGDYEFRAIRPHIMGKFSELLRAAVTHHAMLFYLDQVQSVGPDSPLARQVKERRGRKFGLNENLAREVLELHSLGVRTGYTQADVTELARGLTGFTVAGFANGPARRFVPETAKGGDTVFLDAIHQPGTRQLLGKSYTQTGRAQVEAMLSDLSVHPATAKHIATKLARHFVSDTPPASLITKLEKSFLETGGDLPSIYRALVESEECWPKLWEPAWAKFKSPWDWTISSFRALNMKELPQNTNVAMTMRQMGHPVWQPESPAGFPDNMAQWAGGAALLRRFEIAQRIARMNRERADARILAPQLLPGVLSAHTAESIARAESPMQGLSLLLISPEFLRR